MGLDLGGTYQWSEKITLSASIIDLGFISWKTGVTNFVSKNPDARYTFKGLDINSFLGSGSVSTDSTLSAAGDSLKNLFGIEQTHNNYKTALSAQFYIGGKYAFHKKLDVGGLLYGQLFDGRLRPGISVSGNAKLTKWLSTSLSYSVVNKSYTNVGFGIAITSPVQFYVVTDNVLAPLFPKSAKNFNIRCGINLTFGKKKPKNGEESIIPGSMY